MIAFAFGQLANVDICIEFFITHLIDIIDKHAPMKFKTVR